MFTDGEGRLYPAWSFVLSVLLSSVAFMACGYLAAALAGNHVLRFEAIFRTSLAIVLLAGFSWLLTVANHVESHQIAAQGLPITPGWGRQFASGCAIGFILVACAVLAVAVIGGISFRTTLSLHTLHRLLLVVLVLFTGSLAEELMFRGYPFQRIVEAIGAPGAIASFSVLFALVHFLNPGASPLGMLNTVLIGVVLSFAYLRTRALWLPWGFHFAWNSALGLVFGLPVSGLHLFNVAVRATPSGASWLTGGAYGLEASVPGAVAVIAGLIIIWRAPLRWLGGSIPSVPDAAQADAPRGDINNPPQPPLDLGI